MKKNTALYILAVIICLFLAAFVFHVPALRHLFHNLYGILQSPYILVSAAVCAFLFINTKNYWLIIAGCGIHNAGCDNARHDGIHSFHVGKGANVRYEEKHYGEGDGTGDRILNPVTKIYMDENSVFTLDTAQIKGVDSSIRETEISMEAGAKLFVTERLMTHDKQNAVSNMEIQMNGDGSSAKIASRSVAKGESSQTFHPKAIGNAACHAHVQCDSIIMDKAEVCSIPEINARHIDASIIHEAAIGRINNEQLIKLRTLGLTEEEAEAVIVDAFLE
mgnify:CR=1 FL=1